MTGQGPGNGLMERAIGKWGLGGGGTYAWLDRVARQKGMDQNDIMSKSRKDSLTKLWMGVCLEI